MTLLTTTRGESASHSTTRFGRTTEVRARPDEPGRFDVELDGGWASVTGIHGGSMAAIAVRGAEAVVPDRAVRTLTTTFMRPGAPGPAHLDVEVTRHGRSISSVVADLHQHGRTITSTRLTLVVARDGVEWITPPLHRPVAPIAHCVPIEPPPGNHHFEQAEGLLDPAHIPFTGGSEAVVAGYLRPLERRPVDAAWLAMAVDWFPPPAFVLTDPPAGGVSIDLTTHIHRTPGALADDEWLTASFETTTSVAGLALEHGWIVGPAGEPVAESFHTRWAARS